MVIRCTSASRVLAYTRWGCLYGMAYYTYDSIRELVVHRRWLYIPHHICGVFIFYKILTDSPRVERLIQYASVLAVIESSSVIVNARELLKKQGYLGWYRDLFFFCNYTSIRMLVFPWCIREYAEDRSLYYSCCGILGMSAVWSGKWAMSLYRRRRANSKSEK